MKSTKTYLFFSFLAKIVVVYVTVSVDVYSVYGIPEIESVYVFAGTTVCFSFNTSYITVETDTIRWRFKKQDSEADNLIVEYVSGHQPTIELENLKVRTKFSVTDYSLTVNEVVCDDEGTYFVEARDRNDGSIRTIKKTVLRVKVAGTRQSIQAVAGTAVHLSLNGVYIPCKLDTLRWRFGKQGSDEYSLVVEYNKDLVPVIELPALKGRAKLSKSDYSLVINEVDIYDSGNYKLEARHSDDGRIDEITHIRLDVTVAGIRQSIQAVAGTDVHLSLNGVYIPCKLDTLRWRFGKQGSDEYSLVVKYNKDLVPVIELPALEGRVKLSKSDYSLVINKVDIYDSGNYKLEARHSDNGRIDEITHIRLDVTDVPYVSSVVIAVIVSLILGGTAVAILFSCFWIPALLKCSACKKALTTRLIRRWKIMYMNEEWISLVGHKEQQPMVLVAEEEPQHKV